MTFFKKLRTSRQNIPPLICDHSTAAGVLAVSRPILAFAPLPLPVPSPPESTVASTIGRNASDAAQTFLPPIQAVADAIPGVGGIIKGVIGGMLSTLQLMDVSRLRSYRPRCLTLAFIEIHPEQGRHGAAHPQIAPPSPPHGQCAHCSVQFRGNHETAVTRVRDLRETRFMYLCCNNTSSLAR